MSTHATDPDLVAGAAVPPAPTPEEERQIAQLYEDFGQVNLIPLWTQIGELMPMTPQPQAVPHVWRWKTLLPLAARAGDLIPVGRGGERRAIALANPGLGGRPYATPTLWAAIQYLGGQETAPEHRHSQNAFRFVVEGEGVWTVVNGDPVAMRRGDFLLTPGWNFHGHHNETDRPMAWIDGLDIPFVHYTDTSFFEFGSDRVTDESTPSVSRSEKLWCHPGLRPLTGLRDTISSPIGAYRWEHTEAALEDQLELERAGHPATVEQGHAAVRYVNPTNGRDVLPTIRAEFHRLRPGARTPTRREVGSSVFQVFDGAGALTVDGDRHLVEKGDMIVVPSWSALALSTDDGLDLFRFGDQPIVESLGLSRIHQEDPRS
ncbi:cupin domain-containing protein [Kineosporia sp. NBRC 101731]|uniref:cupin domain-containing protein n=1 Tax=Kineosporia sp. NBRC 101731 TaxID=3032199 RepID=UPI0024A3AEB9|nr:cupin domain-containing protein [Kineosporia sp. NBRC 101731]GLY29726.1 gentisate 1,2-dioxygenase [Kineosporia sp. NBRC 101731]